MVRMEYLTARRLQLIRKQLRVSDWGLLRDVQRLNVLSGQQLRRLHYAESESGRRMARLHLRRLVELRVLVRLGRQIGGRRAGSEGFVYALGVAGQRLTETTPRRPREPWTPTRNSLLHALDVAELYVSLKDLERDGQLVLEAFDAEPRCWRDFAGPGGARTILKPDAFVVTGSTEFLDSWFVEIDRSTEATTRIAAKCRVYSRYWRSGREQTREGVFPSVLFVVPDNRRREQLNHVIKRLPTDERALFRIVAVKTAPQAMASGELLTTNDTRKEVTS